MLLTKKAKIFFYLLKCMELVKNNKFTNIFVVGDFNTVLSNSYDIISEATDDVEEVSGFNSFLKSCHLYDIWHWFNPHTKDFTWKRHNPFISPRLDYI